MFFSIKNLILLTAFVYPSNDKEEKQVLKPMQESKMTELKENLEGLIQAIEKRIQEESSRENFNLSS